MNRESTSPQRFDAESLIARALALIIASPLVFVFVWSCVRTAGATSTTQNKPNIANEVEKSNKNSNEKDNVKPSETPVRPPSGRPTQHGGRPKPIAPPLEVTFKTDVPEAEIFLSNGSAAGMQSLGKTDAEGKLVARLPRGRHNVVASRAGARILRQQIEVQPGSTNFNFNLTLPAPPEKKEEPSGDEASAVSGPPNTEQSGDTGASGDEVVKRFLDSKESDSVIASDWQLVQKQANTALEKEPDDAQLKAQALLAQGQLAYLRGDYASALVAFNKAALDAPDYIAAHYARGNAYLATNQPAESLRAYQRAVELDKDFALGYKGMGDALTKQGRAKEATQYYTRAKNFGQSLPVNTDLSAARELKKRKRWSEALKGFEEVAKTQPTAEVFIDIGDCYDGLEQPLSAAKAYQKATELDPKAALAYYKYGDVMFNLREYASAMEALERALALDTTGASFNRSKAREKANEAAKKLGRKKS